jgi:hypothetical protein
MLAVAVMAVALAAVSANAGVIVSEGFSGGGAELNGTAADTFYSGITAKGGSATWVANSGFKDNGLVSNISRRAAYLNMGSYINDAKGTANGLFKLTMTISETSGTSWLSLGFGQENTPSTDKDMTNSSSISPAPTLTTYGLGTIIYRVQTYSLGGELDMFGGPGSGNAVDGPDFNTGTRTLTVKLDLTPAGGTNGKVTWSDSVLGVIGSYTYTTAQNFRSILITGSTTCTIRDMILTQEGVIDPIYVMDPASGEREVEVDLSSRKVANNVSWQSPDNPDDPNIVQVFGYNLYMDPNRTEVINATPASTNLAFKSLQSGGQTGTSFDPPTNLDYSKTYYWRVDAIVDYDDVPGSTVNDANTIVGSIWSFATVTPIPTNVVTASAMVNNAGDDGTLTVTVDPPLGGTLSYQWYIDYDPAHPRTNVQLLSNGTDYANVTTASLTVKSVQPGYRPLAAAGDENFYYCTVKNSLNDTIVPSNYARLVIKRLVSKYELDTEDNYTDSIGGWNGTKFGDPSLTAGHVGAGAHQFVADNSDGVGINMNPATAPGPWPSTGTQFTVTAWVWYDGGVAQTRWKTIASNGNSSDDAPNNFKFFTLALSSENKLVLGYESASTLLDTNVMPTGEWQFVAAVADGTKYRLYRMGANEAPGRNFQVASTAYTGPILAPEKLPSISGIGCQLKTNALEVGAQPNYWNGKIDDVRIYNYGLSPEAVANLFGSSVCLYKTGSDWAGFDFNNDCQVSLPDFAALAAQWLQEGIYP